MLLLLLSPVPFSSRFPVSLCPRRLCCLVVLEMKSATQLRLSAKRTVQINSVVPKRNCSSAELISRLVSRRWIAGPLYSFVPAVATFRSLCPAVFSILIYVTGGDLYRGEEILARDDYLRENCKNRLGRSLKSILVGEISNKGLNLKLENENF